MIILLNSVCFFRKMNHRKKRNSIKNIAEERINELFAFAKKIFENNEFKFISNEDKQALANRYVELARTISMKCNYPIPKDLKKNFCKHCHTYFRHGINVRVRLNQGKIVKYCLTCKKFSRFPLHVKEKESE